MAVIKILRVPQAALLDPSSQPNSKLTPLPSEILTHIMKSSSILDRISLALSCKQLAAIANSAQALAFNDNHANTNQDLLSDDFLQLNVAYVSIKDDFNPGSSNYAHIAMVQPYKVEVLDPTNILNSCYPIHILGLSHVPQTWTQYLAMRCSEQALYVTEGLRQLCVRKSQAMWQAHDRR